MVEGQQPATPQTTPAPEAQQTNSKYAYKQCPPFDPTFYRVWASEVSLAFAEREWDNYLVNPGDPFIADPKITLHARAFLSQAIPFQYKAGLEHCESAADLFSSLQEQYGSTTREDEFRLETQLMFLRKTATDTIDEHIAKFKGLIAAVMAQQDPASRYRNDKRNQLFLATLEYSDIDDEKWETLIPFLGNTWKNMTPEALFSATRTYYYAHILPKKKKTAPETPISVEGTVYRTQGNDNYNGSHQR
jgi:gag-polypeptide of LTR copia-type